MARLRCNTLAVSALLVLGCDPSTQTTAEPIVCPGDPLSLVRPLSWGIQSHCNNVAAAYTTVFDDTAVRRFELTISAQDHAASMDDMDAKYSGGSPSADLDDAPKPMWVAATLNYQGQTWTQVGMRYKGHSSLKAAWQSGIRKLSFVLDFDQFETDHPEIQNQRFFGFKRLSFSNAFNDPSLLRDKIAAEVFRAGGVLAAQSTFAAVYVDWGEGPVYFGLYTLIEDPCDQMLAAQLGDGSGRAFKPWGDAARWRSLDQIGEEELAAHFEACDNSDSGELDNVMQAITALHADAREPAQWRSQLEASFDVETFLRVLAYNQAMMNWDSYGCMHHNYFMYENPNDNGRLLWFPWDLNEAMLARSQASCAPPGSVLLEEIVSPSADSGIDSDWPLIKILLDDPQYQARYRELLATTLTEGFAADPVSARIQVLNALVAPYVVGPEAVEAYPYSNTHADAFAASLTSGAQALLPHIQARHAAVKSALGL